MMIFLISIIRITGIGRLKSNLMFQDRYALLRLVKIKSKFKSNEVVQKR